MAYLPGGKREEGETDWQALSREVREELSVELVPETLEKVGVYTAQAHGKPEGVLVRMTCYRARHEGVIRPAAEIEAVSWLTSKDRESLSPVAQIVLDRLRDDGWID